MTTTPFKVGTCIVLRHNQYVLMGLRKGSHGAGTWSFPGGHVDGIENPEESVIRELKEETGIEIEGSLNKLGFVLSEFSPEKRYITLYFGYDVGECLIPTLMEPDKCAEWKWFHEEDLPDPLFEPIQNFLKQHKDVLPV